MEEKSSVTTSSALAIRSQSEIISKAQQNATEPDDPASQEPIEGGPKTADMPDDPIPSTRLLEELDLSPDPSQDQWKQLQEVIQQNQMAFGLDSRLGTNDARVEIQLKLGSQPVSLPPFPVSPSKP